MQIIWLVIIFLVCFCVYLIKNREVANFITAFLVTDVSNTERENLIARDKIYFYDSISTISKALICGFSAPYLYIALFGNTFAIIYMFICNLYFIDKDYNIYRIIFNALTIIPAFIIESILFIIYIIRNGNKKLNFRGDFLVNSFARPLLNVDILAAYIESVNFYFHYNENNTEYLKSYGDFNKKIDVICIKDYLGIVYTVCILLFVIFFAIERLILKNI